MRLTETNPIWADDETWLRAREPDEDDIDNVYFRLKEFEDAEEQGLLVRLPAKLGTKIFEANAHTGKVFQRIASKEDMLTKIMPGWGTRYFATPAEAEQALKGE